MRVLAWSTGSRTAADQPAVGSGEFGSATSPGWASRTARARAEASAGSGPSKINLAGGPAVIAARISRTAAESLHTQARC